MEQTIKMTGIHNLLLGLFLCVSISSCGPSNSNNQKGDRDKKLVDKIDAYINVHVANTRFNGNLLVVKEDSIVY